MIERFQIGFSVGALLVVSILLPACEPSDGDDDESTTMATGGDAGLTGSSGTTGSSTGSTTDASATGGGSTTDASTTTGGTTTSTGSTGTGTGTDSGTDASTGTSGGQCGNVDLPVPGLTGCGEYDQCVATHCSETMTYCLGANILVDGSFDPARPCGDFVPCAFACDCEADAQACVDACDPAAQLTCLPCLGVLKDCAVDACGEQPADCSG